MGRKRYTPEQIIRLLRQSEVLPSEGRNLPEICREIGGSSEHLLPLEEGIRRYAGQSGHESLHNGLLSPVVRAT
jgi:transposase